MAGRPAGRTRSCPGHSRSSRAIKQRHVNVPGCRPLVPPRIVFVSFRFRGQVGGGLGLVWFAYPFRFARAAVPSLAVALARLLYPCPHLRVHQTLSTPRARTCAAVASGEQASKQLRGPVARSAAVQALCRGAGMSEVRVNARSLRPAAVERKRREGACGLDGRRDERHCSGRCCAARG